MNEIVEASEWWQHIDQRLDTIEELLKMNIVQSVINDLSKEEDGQQLLLLDHGSEIWNWLQVNGFSCLQLFSFGSSTCLMLETEGKLNIRLIRRAHSEFSEQFVGYTPVFYFQTLNSATKRKLREENIAFYLDGKELHIIR